MPKRGPGTKGRRRVGEGDRLRGAAVEDDAVREWMEQDLVIATGQVEGAVRHVVGERWIVRECVGFPERRRRCLHLRCIELNGDWESSSPGSISDIRTNSVTAK